MIPTPGAAPLFRDFAKRWLDDKKHLWKKSHTEATCRTVNRLIREFGELEVSKISRTDIENFSASLRTTKTKRKKTLAVGSINEVLRPLRLILKEAATELGVVSPMEGLKCPQLARTEITPLTLTEVEAFLEKVRSDYRNYYTIRFFTGLKTSEAHGLKWKYVDFDAKTIRVHEILVGRKMDLETNPQLQRCVNMCDRVIAALRQQYALTGTTDFVFNSTQGCPLNSTQVSKEIWFPTLEALKLAKRHPNQIRHTAAALFLAAGENPAWVARQMGYSYTANFIITYWEYLPYAVDANGAAFNKMVASSPAKEGIRRRRPASPQLGKGS